MTLGYHIPGKMKNMEYISPRERNLYSELIR